MPDPQPLILVATPFHPDGTVLTAWALYTLDDVMRTQAPPGTRLGSYYRNEGEDCATAYAQIVRYAWGREIPFIFFLEDDIYLPDGAIQTLYQVLAVAENKDVAGVGALYFWRAGPIGCDFPLVFPHECQGPCMDYTPGEVLEVDAAGQGAFLLRTHALTDQPEPWFALDWRREDSLVAYKDAADLFFFRKLRSAICPHTKRPWRVLCHTGVTCEHQDRKSRVIYPRDPKIRERFGFARESELLRRARPEQERLGAFPSLLNELGMTHGEQPRAVPPAFRPNPGVALGRPVAIPRAKVPENPVNVTLTPEPFLVLNVGWGGVPPSSEMQAIIKQMAGGRRIQIETNDVPSGAAWVEETYDDVTDWIGPCSDLGGSDPCEADRFDLVYASHVVEHIPRGDLVKSFRELLRVTRPLGKIYVRCPDITTIGYYIRDGKLDLTLYIAGNGMEITPRLMAWGGQRYEGDYHLNGIGMSDLRDAAYEAGAAPEEVYVCRPSKFECQIIIWKGGDLVEEIRSRGA